MILKIQHQLNYQLQVNIVTGSSYSYNYDGS